MKPQLDEILNLPMTERLIKDIKELQKNYVGKEYDDNVFYGTFELLASDDDADTDIHICVVKEVEGEESIEIEFGVEVNPCTNEIVLIDTNDVNIHYITNYDSFIYEFIDIN